MSLSRRHLSHFAAVVLVGGLLQPPPTRAADPDARALLRAVEAARAKIGSGRAKLQVTYRNPTFTRHPGPPIRLEVAFDGDKRRFDQFCREGSYNPKIEDVEAKAHELDDDPEKLAAAGLVTYYDVHIRSSWDGARMVLYRGMEHASVEIKDEETGSGYSLFDLRSLGLASSLGITDQVGDIFPDRPNRTITLVGREEVAGHSTWHVRVDDKHPDGETTAHYWVEDVPGYPVWMVEEVGSTGRKTIVTASYRDPVTENPIPVLVMVSRRDAKGNQSSLTTTTVEEAEWDVPIDPAIWTLATMEIPPGTAVIDERLHRRVGYFDGEGLRDDFLEALRIGRERAAAVKPRR